MRAEDFDEEAMERKIEKNLKSGFDITGIKTALLDEASQNIRESRLREARAAELLDQIDYMNEKYGGKI